MCHTSMPNAPLAAAAKTHMSGRNMRQPCRVQLLLPQLWAVNKQASIVATANPKGSCKAAATGLQQDQATGQAARSAAAACSNNNTTK